MYIKKMREKVLVNVFKICCIVVFGGLTFYSFIQTGYSPFDLSSEAVFFKNDNGIVSLLWVLGVVAVLFVLLQYVNRVQTKINTRFLAIGAALLSVVVSLLWVAGSNIAPVADQSNVLYYAWAFNEGIFSGFEKGKYVATCPHQLGMISILRIMYYVLRDRPNPYLGFQVISAVCVGIIVYAGYELVRNISKKNAFAELIYLLLAVTCFPLYAYTPFVYGEIPSTAFLFVGAWAFLSAMEKMKWYKVFSLAVCCGLAVQLRQNSLIILVGFAVLLIVKLIQQFKWRYLVLMATVFIGYWGSNFIIDAMYHEHYQEDAHAIPNILYITMGTNWEEENPGWFSKYNYTVFFENDCNAEAASQVALRDLGLFVQKCLDDKAYAVDFLGQKILAQWNDPMYHCLVMNQNIQYEQFPIIADIYFGSLRSVVEEYMNIYQLIVYGSILGLFILTFKKWDKIEPFVLMIGIFGGFLFTIIWEAKTRYVFPYFIMMLPYAAVGLQQVINKLEEARCYIFHKIVRK